MTAPRAAAYDRTKRLLDVVVAGTALVASAPVQAVIAVLVARDLGRPVLFRQERPGKDGKPFTMVKFRSMKAAPEGTSPLHDAERLTRFGRLLRSTSLDELPSLWNVVRGDMSLVGPRPLLMQYLPLYSAGQARRHEVRPGLTGLAQVRGRNLLSWEDRFALDVEYVENRSLRLDLRIIRETLAAVVSRRGVSSGTSETMEPFAGSPPVGLESDVDG
jgi:lipopolysaccharide/colanic/teichoic acid biosynthesis glycosyltransferase